MIELTLYPIIAILGGGLGIYFLVQRHYKLSLKPSEVFLFSIISGSFFITVPWVFIGIQPESLLKIKLINFTIFTIDFGTYIIAIYGIMLFLSLYAGYKLLEMFIESLENVELDNIRESITITSLLPIIIIGEYILIQLLLPLRGFDAMYYYFPEAEIFYLTDSIVDINYLSFQPVVKSPFNVLLFSFALYITHQASYQLYPILFIIGLIVITYNFALELWGNEYKARFAAMVLLVTPVIYWVVSYWVYYQDLYVSFFCATAFYYVWKGVYKSKENQNSYIVMGIMSMALALLSKIDAWPLFILIVIALPVSRNGKTIQTGIVAFISAFLIVRASTAIYIGVGFLIFIFTIYIVYLIWKREDNENTVSVNLLVSFIAGGLFFGGFWIIDRITKSIEFVQELDKLYFTLGNRIIWDFQNFTEFSFDFTLERMQAVNFFSACLFFLTGIAFCLPWVVPKVIALINGTKNATIQIWVMGYLIIWTAYYFKGSVRYLSPIYIPIVLLIVFGFFELIEKFNVDITSRLPSIAMIFLGCANFYYLINLDLAIMGENTQELVGDAYNKAAFHYYSHPETGILQSILFLGLWIIILYAAGGNNEWIDRQLHKMKDKIDLSKYKKNFITLGRYSVYILLILVVSIPIAVQGYVFATSSFNIEVFQETMEYEYNEDYKTIIDKILDEGSLTGGIITVRMPGVNFFAKKPVLDFYYQSTLLGRDFYESENLTYLIDILKAPVEYLLPEEYNITVPFNIYFEFIVVPNTQNIYYEIYQDNIVDQSFFFRSLTNSTYFEQIFENPRYLLYKIK